MHARTGQNLYGPLTIVRRAIKIFVAITGNTLCNQFVVAVLHPGIQAMNELCFFIIFVLLFKIVIVKLVFLWRRGGRGF